MKCILLYKYIIFNILYCIIYIDYYITVIFRFCIYQICDILNQKLPNFFMLAKNY